jgi:hypothetical protein
MPHRQFAGLKDKSKELPTLQQISSINCNLHSEEDSKSRSSAYAKAPAKQLFT